MLNESGLSKRYLNVKLTDYKLHSAEYEHAMKCAQNLLANPDSTGILLLGKVGTGKTILASIIIKEFISKYKKPAQIISALRLFRQVKQTYGSKTENEADVIEGFSRIPLLVIDEIGVQYNSQTEQTILMDIIDSRYNNMLPTVLVGNVTLTELSEIIGIKGIDRIYPQSPLHLATFTGKSQR